MTGDRIRLVVLYGGQSAEHEVSRISARHVVAAANPDRYEIVPIGITKSGQWVQSVAAREAIAAMAAGSPDALADALPIEGSNVEPLSAVRGAVDPGGAGAAAVVVFPLLHGPLGEDGTVQGLLELAGVPYVGCGVLSSALAMDKAKAKEMFVAAGIPQARFVAFGESEVHAGGIGPMVDRLGAELGYPMFVKPSNMGSSIGVTKASEPAVLAGAIELALTYDGWVVCEENVEGREIECSVLGNEAPRASLPGEVVPGADFYDYEDKYLDGRAKLLIPAPLPDVVTSELRSMAIRAYQALRCEGMARVDIFYEEGGRGLLVNEINTIPGFTPISMYPQLWQATGLSYPDLIDELVRLAIDRQQRRRRRVD